MLTIFKDLTTYSISSIFTTLPITNIWDTIYKKKTNFFCLLIFYIYGILSIWIPQKLRIIVCVIVSYILVKVYYHETWSKSLNGVLVQSLMTMFSELFITIVSSAIFKDNLLLFLSSRRGILTISILVGIIIFVATKLKIPVFIYDILNKITNSIKTKKKLLYIISVMIIINVITYYGYYNYNINSVLIVNTISIFIYTMTLFYIFKIDNFASKLKDKYHYNLNALTENEKIISEYRTNSHEFKNTIRTIKHMIEIDDPQVLNFINSTLKELNTNDKKILEISSKIPLNGLKSLVHSKLILMKENKIKYSVYVDKKIKDLSIDDDTIRDICKIIGIFLDNAIEEVKKYKTKKINIYMYQDKDLFIEISNNYQNLSFKSKKGKDRGYGLKLVEQIIDNNKKLINTKRITNNIFTQTLQIKST